MPDEQKLRGEAWEKWKDVEGECGGVNGWCAWCTGESETLDTWVHDRDGFAAFLAKYKSTRSNT